MTKQEFNVFFKNECNSRGFRKVKKYFYLLGTEVMCSIHLQKSNYGNVYYVNYCFYIGDFRQCKDYPTHYDADIVGRINVMSKTQQYQGKCFMTSMIEYDEYTAEEYDDEWIEGETIIIEGERQDE